MLTQKIILAIFACAALGLLFASLRKRYPLIVAWVAVLAVVTLPHVAAAFVDRSEAALPCAMAIMYAAVIPWLLPGVNGIVASAVFSATWALFWFGGHVPTWPRELLAVPEWHLVLAALGAWRTWHFRRDDATGVALLAMAVAWGVLATGPARFVLLGPLAALGAGRILYRGTLTREWRIPPATWAMILLAIAAIRSTVIMTTWAPHWQDYQNRLAVRFADESPSRQR
jgi:hypothetical protein